MWKQSKAKLVKAHIIPESFFVGYDRSMGVSKLMTNIDGVYPKKAPIGVYDKSILCRECEDTFQEYDDYAAKVLLNKKSAFNELIRDCSVIGWQRPNVDYKKLKVFFLSLLWRASVSVHPCFSKVALGSLEEVVKNMVWAGLPGSNDAFSCVLYRYHFDVNCLDVDLGFTWLNPHQETWDDKNWTRIYFGEYMLLIRCDKQCGPEWLERLRFEDSEVLTVIARSFIDSAEFDLMKKIISKNERK
ncbi:MAG: hypothetical protein ACU88J_05650 [Gammaproteobacteria bacterium]